MIEQLEPDLWAAEDQRPGHETRALFTINPDRKDHIDTIREVWAEDVYQMESLNFEGRTVIDVGAHIGTVTVRAALAGARVIAIEPFKEARDLLVRNVAHNNVHDRVLVVGLPLSETPVTVEQIGDTGMGHTEPGDGPHLSVWELAALIANPDIAMLKIDTEGAEHPLFASPSDELRELLANSERVTLETHPGPNLGDILATLLHTHSIQAAGSPDVGGFIHAYRY